MSVYIKTGQLAMILNAFIDIVLSPDLLYFSDVLFGRRLVLRKSFPKMEGFNTTMISRRIVGLFAMAERLHDGIDYSDLELLKQHYNCNAVYQAVVERLS